SIDVQLEGRSGQATLPPGLPPEFEDMFRFDLPEAQPQSSRGSGFIFDPRGYIMTNNHVVENATSVTVQLNDGRVYDATVVGRDPNTDVAVIKIEPRPGETLPVAEIGDSDAVLVGDWVLALGNPLGLNFTVTAGIVSAKNRSIDIIDRGEGGAPLEAFIQTDAAINPGNSGGPLVDLMGRVVGVNSAIASRNGLNAGYGFAIPIRLARRIAGDLIEHGSVRRPRLGVLIQAVTDVDAELYGLPSIAGAHITGVQQGTPAEAAGVRMGDVVVAVDGNPIRTATDLQTDLAYRQPGDRVTLTLYRDGQRRDVQVTLGQFDPPVSQTAQRPVTQNAAEVLGFRAAPRGRGNSDSLVIEVIPGSAAARAGVVSGQTLVKLNGVDIRSTADFDRAAANVNRGDIVSVVVRDQDGLERIVNYRTR
ncbi:MAG TPA: trypsin-like peptidase domain-containing protein, partial [Longimicrobiales bacterium]|nr:trypsin-like peptidase domain-containing protein [Longimicrobiales bacterium]